MAELRYGTLLVADIGGGTISLGLFASGGLCYTAVLPYGGNHITNDIAMGLRTSFGDAERLKIRHGCALPQQVGEDELEEARRDGSSRRKRKSATTE